MHACARVVRPPRACVCQVHAVHACRFLFVVSACGDFDMADKHPIFHFRKVFPSVRSRISFSLLTSSLET